MKLDTLKEILHRNGFEIKPISIPDNADLSEKLMCLQDDLDEYANVANLRNKLTKSLSRATRRKEQYQERFDGREQKLTFYAGWDLGFFAGKEDALTDALDELIFEKDVE